MAAHETHLLLLGAVSIFEPVNGYQIRRELLSWGVEEWANVHPGSIYNGLATLAQRGELVRHDLRDGGRDVAVYELSDTGRAEFARLYEAALTEVRPSAPVAFQTAVSMLNLCERTEVLRMLRVRLANLERLGEDTDAASDRGTQIPPHVHEFLELGKWVRSAEVRWLERLIGRVEGGALEFLGEARTWAPAADDPGWQLSADRDRYLTILGR